MKTEPMDLPAMMTSQEVALYLRLSPKCGEQTVRRWARGKKIKGFLVGSSWRFSREAVVAFLRGNKK